MRTVQYSPTQPSLTRHSGAPQKPFHSFAVCAYGDSPYLPACLRSLKGQTVPSEILICTSTPSPYLSALAETFRVPLCVRQGTPGIGADWNFAFQRANGRYVTLAHQDDVYEKRYTERLCAAAERWPDMTLFTSGSVTVKDGAPVGAGLPELVKEALRLPLRFVSLSHLRAVKRLPLLLGNALICPASAYRKDSCPEAPFSAERRFVLDWEFLLSLADRPGRFVLDPDPLIFYRVHADAATAKCIGDRTREREEREVFQKLWPAPVARLLMHYYRRSYLAYTEK